MVIAPIYKDTYYTASTSVLQYTILTGGKTIFSGRAYRMPSEDTLRININKVCKDYLTQDLETVLGGSSSQTNSKACLDFVLKNSGGTTLETFRFLYCWDYDYTWTGQSATLSESINGHYASGQLRLSTTVSTGNTSNTNTVTTVSNNSSLYTKVVCADYVLHFVGARGGWMSFAFEGRCTKSDGVKQYLYDKAFNNNTKEFEKTNYLNEITTTYKLNTGVLTEAQSLKFAKNVGSSTKAYLQILSEGRIVPVLITDTNVQYKTDNQNEIITYEVNVKESQSKIKN